MNNGGEFMVHVVPLFLCQENYEERSTVLEVYLQSVM